MRILLVLSLVFIFHVGYSQNSNKERILGSWTQISSTIIYPYYCGPQGDSTANSGRQFIFYKLSDFILSPSEKHEDGTLKGIWTINNENNLVISFEDESLELKIRFRNGKLYLRNSVVELEFERR